MTPSCEDSGVLLEPSSYPDAPVRQEGQLPPRNHTALPARPVPPRGRSLSSCPLLSLALSASHKPGDSKEGRTPWGSCRFITQIQGDLLSRAEQGGPTGAELLGEEPVSTVLKAWLCQRTPAATK